MTTILSIQREGGRKGGREPGHSIRDCSSEGKGHEKSAESSIQDEILPFDKETQTDTCISNMTDDKKKFKEKVTYKE